MELREKFLEFKSGKIPAKSNRRISVAVRGEE